MLSALSFVATFLFSVVESLPENGGHFTHVSVVLLSNTFTHATMKRHCIEVQVVFDKGVTRLRAIPSKVCLFLDSGQVKWHVRRLLPSWQLYL